MDQTPKIFIDLPESVIQRIEERISKKLIETLEQHAKEMYARPNLLTRAKAAKLLRISLPTLRKLEVDGKLIPQRAGTKVLYDQHHIETFLKSQL